MFALPSTLHACIKTGDFTRHLQQREDNNLGIQGIIETAGTLLVAPARTARLESGTSPASD